MGFVDLASAPRGFTAAIQLAKRAADAGRWRIKRLRAEKLGFQIQGCQTWGALLSCLGSLSFSDGSFQHFAGGTASASCSASTEPARLAWPARRAQLRDCGRLPLNLGRSKAYREVHGRPRRPNSRLLELQCSLGLQLAQRRKADT